MNKDERRFSVIMTVYDQAYELQENLTAFLTQQYQPGYEVVVVDESSTDETPDILKLLKKDYPNLYTTFLPKSEGHAMSKKQAYNIGIKAAKNDWPQVIVIFLASASVIGAFVSTGCSVLQPANVKTNDNNTAIDASAFLMFTFI